MLPGAFPNLLANGSAGIAVGMATNIPPHNAAELCDAALHLIKHPNATLAKLMEFVPGPDFPTGGIIVSSREALAEAYRTGRGAIRVRARWEKEDLGRGTWVVGDHRDSLPGAEEPAGRGGRGAAWSSESCRSSPTSATRARRTCASWWSRAAARVDPALMMESLFRTSELETRFSLNMNVLSHGQVPNVLSLRDVLLQWLDHRKIVLVRRSHFRLGKIAQRLEVLGGLLIAYLNIDEVIRIIREEDDPKAVMMARWDLTDVQVEAILNMRLRALRKLEEIEIRTEFDALKAEQADLEGLVVSDERQWKCVAYEISEVRKKFGPDTPLGKRRTGFADAPDIDIGEMQQAMIEREPVTVILSEKGWIRALRGHLTDFSTLAFKEGDHLKRAFTAQTTDKVLVLSTGGKFFTLEAAKLPGGRGHGEPVRLMLDMDKDQDVVTIFPFDPNRRLVVASAGGYGFVVAESELVANTRKGRQVLNVAGADEAKVCVAAEGDMVAVVGTNRKMLIFPMQQLPEMARGKGVRLQRYKDGEISDVRVFSREAGLSWTDGAGRTHTRRSRSCATGSATARRRGGWRRRGSRSRTGSGRCWRRRINQTARIGRLGGCSFRAATSRDGWSATGGFSIAREARTMCYEILGPARYRPAASQEGFGNRPCTCHLQAGGLATRLGKPCLTTLPSSRKPGLTRRLASGFPTSRVASRPATPWMKQSKMRRKR